MSARSWCVRCGRPYEAGRPTCEHAGDPPVDHTGPEWREYLHRVDALRFVDALAECVVLNHDNTECTVGTLAECEAWVRAYLARCGRGGVVPASVRIVPR